MNIGGFASALVGRENQPATASSQQREKDRAILIARVLLKPGSGIDPNSDIGVLARQLLRALALI